MTTAPQPSYWVWNPAGAASYEDNCRTHFGSPENASGHWRGNSIQATGKHQVPPFVRRPSHDGYCRTQFGSPGLALELCEGSHGNSIQASVESRITQVRTASAPVKKRDEQTRSSSRRVSERMKRQRKTSPNASVSWTLLPQSGLSPDQGPDLRITWQEFSSSNNESFKAPLD